MDAQEAKKRMEEGRLYYPNEEGITKYQFAAMEAMYEYNATHAMETEKRAELLKKMLAEVGENCYIEAPFYANWGGSHVHFGDNVWIGAGAVVLPGVTIGENSVIGAGSVVTKDIPANVVAVGNPCRVLREIGEHDREFYYRDRRIDL